MSTHSTRVISALTTLLALNLSTTALAKSKDARCDQNPEVSVESEFLYRIEGGAQIPSAQVFETINAVNLAGVALGEQNHLTRCQIWTDNIEVREASLVVFGTVRCTKASSNHAKEVLDDKLIDLMMGEQLRALTGVVTTPSRPHFGATSHWPQTCKT